MIPLCGIVSNVFMKITIVPRPQDGSIIISVEAHMINYEEPISQIKCGYSPGVIYVWYVDTMAEVSGTSQLLCTSYIV